MSELYCQGAKERHKTHHQAPLNPGCIHVNTLGHEDKIWKGQLRKGALLATFKPYSPMAFPITSQTLSTKLTAQKDAANGLPVQGPSPLFIPSTLSSSPSSAGLLISMSLLAK